MGCESIRPAAQARQRQSSRPLFWAVLWLFWLLITLVMARTAAAQSNPLSETEYWRLLTDAQTLTAQTTGAPPEMMRARLRELAARLEKITAVTLPNGEQTVVNHAFLVAELRSVTPDPTHIHALLTTLLAAHAHGLATPFPTFDDNALAQILARPEFLRVDSAPPAWLKWLDEQWRRLLRWLDELLPAGAVGGAPAGPVEQIATLVLLLLLATLLAYALQGIFADMAAESVLAAEEDAAGEPLTADSALRRAQELSGGGDYRSAVRYLYLSTLLRLEERGLLRYDRSLTNREYLRRVAHDPGLTTVLQDVVEVFDRVWYGYQPLDAPGYQRYATAVEELKHYRP